MWSGAVVRLKQTSVMVPPSWRSRGFSMVEVLVAIVILSFGLLGVVGLQAAAIKNTRDARQQSVAVVLARELADMMRANPQVAARATNNPYHGNFSDNGSGMQPATVSNCLDVGSRCASANDIANAQMTEWLARVSNLLPGARVSICRDTAPYDANGLPQWACTSSATASQNIAFIKIGWLRENTKGQIVNTSDAGTRPYILLPVTPSGQL